MTMLRARPSRAGLSAAVLALGLAAVLLLPTGCAMAMAPVTGVLYPSVDAPLDVNSESDATKMGSATCKSYLGLVATGDASIAAAAKAGGISKIRHVDYRSHSVLGVYAEFTTVVYGE